MKRMKLAKIVWVNLATTACTTSSTLAQGGYVSGWGWNDYGQTSIPAGLANVSQVACGWIHTYALKSDGTTVGWGYNYYGQTSTPAGLANVSQVACGGYHTYALKNDGTLVGWGYNYYGQTNTPAGLANVSQVACGYWHTYALKNDGTLIGWGYNGNGETNTPAGLANVSQVACGHYHTYALKNDGTLIGWGYNDNGETNTPAGLANVSQVACGHYHTYVLKNDGTVVGWGYNDNGQTSTPSAATNITQVACGRLHTYALKRDGSLIQWGYNGYGQTNTPSNQYAFLQIACGGNHTIALRNINDCDGNGIDDPHQVTLPDTWDLNNDRILDICQFGRAFDETSPDLGTPAANIARTHTFTNLIQIPAADPQLVIEARGDLDELNEYLTVRLNGTTFTRVFESNGIACADGVSRATITIPRSSWNNPNWQTLTTDGSLTVTLLPSPTVQASGCTGSMTVRLRYLAGDDCDSNGTMDGFQIAAGLPDDNGNGRLDSCEWRKGDLDLSGTIDFGDVAILMLYFGEVNPAFGDMDANNRIDFGDVALLLLDFGPVQWP
jgi:alpha-tubulin suppressor-like RCC1 family protein